MQHLLTPTGYILPLTAEAWQRLQDQPDIKKLGKLGDFTRDTHVGDLIRLAETVTGETPATLVTWSYGGEIGLHAIRRRPDLFRAAVHDEPILAGHLAP